MALIKCNECGKEISDSALACPNCGWKTPHAQRVEVDKTVKHTSTAISWVYSALWIIGGILFLFGYVTLSDWGYGFFDSWIQSSSDTVVAAGRNCVIGILLILIGVIGGIMFQKNKYSFESNLRSSSVLSQSKERFYTSSSTSTSTKRCCPHCGNVVTSNVCDTCGKNINSAPDRIPTRKRIQSEQESNNTVTCPNCGQTNLSSRTSCWKCNHQF